MASIPDFWDGLWAAVDDLRAGIARSKAVNVNVQRLRDSAREVVESYFRRVRPSLIGIGIVDDDLVVLDRTMQALLQLSHGRNPKQSYLRVMRDMGRERSRLAPIREQKLGERLVSPASEPQHSETEQRIIQTVGQLVPSATLSYEQALSELRGVDRLSYRGTAVELRETLREVLDHLAPDQEVMNVPGFKLEQDRQRPTMRQKARFVLRSRGLSATLRKAPEDTISLVDERTSSLVRSAYERGSVSTHVAMKKPEVQQLKLYIDSVLAELLQIHQ
jgi:hypothetical protein